MSTRKLNQRAALASVAQALTCQRCGRVNADLSGFVVGVKIHGGVEQRVLCNPCNMAYDDVGCYNLRDFAQPTLAARRISRLRQRYPGPSIARLPVIAAAAQAMRQAGEVFRRARKPVRK